MVTLKAQGQSGVGSWKRQRDWSPNSFTSGSEDTQDADLARAIAASLGQSTGHCQIPPWAADVYSFDTVVHTQSRLPNLAGC
jgi:hypothetical protein